jgi:hypothetical protein
MNDKIFNRAINAYKVGNIEPLKEFVSNAEEIRGSDWSYIFNLMQEEIVFNMPMGSLYIRGTLPIFTEALEKADYKTGALNAENKFGLSVLAEQPEVFNEFINLYASKVLLPTSLSSSLLAIHPDKKEIFWSSFFNNYLESLSLSDFTDKEVYNIAANTNKIFDLDKTQHKYIARAIEFDSNYPIGEVLQQALTYVIDFDNFAPPRTNIKKFGRNEDTLIKCKKFANVLENSKTKAENKAKLKI